MLTLENKSQWVYKLVEHLVCFGNGRHYESAAVIRWDDDCWALFSSGSLTQGSTRRKLTVEDARKIVLRWREAPSEPRGGKQETVYAGGFRQQIWVGRRNPQSYYEGIPCPECRGRGYLGGSGSAKRDCPTCEGKRFLKELPAKSAG